MKIASFAIAFLVAFLLSIAVAPSHAPLYQRQDSRALEKAFDRSEQAAKLFREVMELPVGIALEVPFDEAEALAIFTDTERYSTLLSDNYALGLVSLRDERTRMWSPPVFLKLNGENAVSEVCNGGTLFIFAFDRESARAFLSDRFEMGAAMAGAISSGPELKSKGYRAYLRHAGEEEGYFNPLLSDAVVWHDRELNAAVYGERQLKTYLPVAKLLPSRALAFTDLLNAYTSKGGV